MSVGPRKPNLKRGAALVLALVAQTVFESRPAETLRPDALDAPAATSLAEAERAAALAKEMAGHHGMSHGTPYRQQDAGREPQAKPTPKPSPHHHEEPR